jgi:hypothetical protein
MFGESLASDTLMGVLASLVAAGLLLAAWAFTQPTTELGVVREGYAHSVSWAYDEGAGASSITPDNPLLEGGTATGQPIFPSVTPDLAVEMRYRLSAPSLTETSGQARLFVVMREDTAGWSSEFELLPWTEFEGSEVDLSSVIELTEAIEVFGAFGASVGLRSSLYRAVLATEVRVNGVDEAGHPFTDHYRSHVSFRVDLPDLIRPETPGGATAAEVLVAGIDPFASTFNQISPRELIHSVEVTRVVTVFFWDIPISALRLGALTLIIASAGAALGLYRLRAWADQRGAWFMIRARYGHRIAFAPAPPEDAYDRGYIDVTDFDDVLALSDARMQPIICVETENNVEFFVLDLPNGIYRLRLRLSLPWEDTDEPPQG